MDFSLSVIDVFVLAATFCINSSRKAALCLSASHLICFKFFLAFLHSEWICWIDNVVSTGNLRNVAISSSVAE